MKHKNTCVACGEHNEQGALYCSTCGNYLPKDFFEYLGISRDADAKVIRDAFLKQAIQCRPEKTQHLSRELQGLAAQKLQQLNYIWDVLRDDQKRSNYLAKLQQEERLAESGQLNSLEALLWRRWCARFIDYILFAVLCSSLLQAIHPGLFEWLMLDFSQSEYLRLTLLLTAFGMSIVGAWAPFEALFLSTLGTTPGKWLFQMQVVGASAQTKLPLKAALSRAMQVWSLGMGMGILFLVPIANGFWHYRFKKGQRTHWDTQTRCEIIEQPLSVFRVAASSMITLQSFALGFLLLGPLPNPVNTNHAYKATVVADHEPTRPPAPVKIEPVQAVQQPLSTTQTITPLPKQGPTHSAEPQVAKAAVKPVSPVNEPVAVSKPVVKPVQPEKPTLMLPPSIHRVLESASEDKITADVTTAPTPQAHTTVAPARKLSEEQRLACVQRYYDAMSEADDLPLGDYARINKKAAAQRDRCLVGG